MTPVFKVLLPMSWNVWTKAFATLIPIRPVVQVVVDDCDVHRAIL